jgi:purine-binding chemotaxis protein CheW
MSPRESVAGQYLAFKLGNEEYGLPIQSVREIIGIQPITMVPLAPEMARGVINLRGKIVPVADLRVRFGMDPGREPEPCIIIVRSRGADIGVLVDAVFEVVRVQEGELSAPPPFNPAAVFVRGIAKVAERVRFLLDIDLVLEDLDREQPSNVGPKEGIAQ